ncbi:MAG: DNA polymerase III subunit gamma/tau, partial [Congregibacter sp.]|nr:DNA polymerase III subunit gamma/tau [Congregibacter sp.]
LIASVQGTAWHLLLDEGRTNLFNERHVGVIAKALSAWSRVHCDLSISIGPVQEETPAMRRLRLDAERQVLAATEINDDPQIQRLLQEFDAKLLQDSVTVEQP